MKRRIALAAWIALTFVGASWELNPLVTRTAQPSGPVPVGCDESLAPASTPRVDVAQIPMREEIVPVSMPPAAPPPSRSLREELDSAQRALVRNDRPSFDDRLRAARAIVATYPTGAERSRAEEVLWALNDASALWDVQFTEPFFDDTSDAYARASRYAGYADAMRRMTLTDASGRRFYPAAESRDFIASIAAERLQRLGVRGASTPAPRVARAETRTGTRASSSSSTSSTSTRRATTTTQSARRSSPRRVPRRSTAPSTKPSSPKPSKPAAPALAAPSSSPDPSKATPSPAPAEPAPTTPPASAPSSSTSADAPASPVAEPATAPVPTVTSAPETPASEPAPPTTSAPAEKRSVIIPALLILIGLGVLIVLFRTSR